MEVVAIDNLLQVLVPRKFQQILSVLVTLLCQKIHICLCNQFGEVDTGKKEICSFQMIDKTGTKQGPNRDLTRKWVVRFKPQALITVIVSLGKTLQWWLERPGAQIGSNRDEPRSCAKRSCKIKMPQDFSSMSRVILWIFLFILLGCIQYTDCRLFKGA